MYKSKIFFVILLVTMVMVSCFKSNDSPTIKEVVLQPNTAIVGGVLRDFSLSSYIVRQDSSTMTFVGNWGIKTGLTYENSLNFTLVSKSALKVDNYYLIDTFQTSRMNLAIQLGNKSYSVRNNEISIDIERMDSIISGIFYATIYLNDTTTTLKSLGVRGAFSAKY